MTKKLIGSEEWCAFPTLGIPAIKARIDSGAKTSSIHAFNIRTFLKEGESWVSFEVHPLQNDRQTTVRCMAPLVDRRLVKSSSGDTNRRYVILVPMSLGDETWEVEVTLANRDSMGYRMLLGREAMNGRVVVDPAEKLLQQTFSKKKLKEIYAKQQLTYAGLRIAVLGAGTELYSNQRLIEAASDRGHEALFLDIRDCTLKNDLENLELHHKELGLIENIDAVIPRITARHAHFGLTLVRHFLAQGIHVLNPVQSIRTTLERTALLQQLQHAGVLVPLTVIATSPVDAATLIDLVGGAPLTVQWLEDAQYSEVVLAESRQAAETVINAFASVKADLLVQEYVREAGGTDLRLVMQQDQLLLSVERTPAPGGFRVDPNQGGTILPVKVSDEELSLARKVMAVLDLNLASVDLMRTHRGPMVIKVNASPALENLESATGQDLAGAIIHQVEQLLEWLPEEPAALTEISS